MSPPLQYGADYGSRDPDHHPIFRGGSEDRHDRVDDSWSKEGAVVSPIKCTLRCSGQAQLSEHHVVSVEITGSSKNGSGTGKVQSLSSTKKQSAPRGRFSSRDSLGFALPPWLPGTPQARP